MSSFSCNLAAQELYTIIEVEKFFGFCTKNLFDALVDIRASFIETNIFSKESIAVAQIPLAQSRGRDSSIISFKWFVYRSPIAQYHIINWNIIKDLAVSKKIINLLQPYLLKYQNICYIFFIDLFEKITNWSLGIGRNTLIAGMTKDHFYLILHIFQGSNNIGLFCKYLCITSVKLGVDNALDPLGKCACLLLRNTSISVSSPFALY